ncbi:MAG: aminopeptidase P family protein [Actinomycetota bacterium]
MSAGTGAGAHDAAVLIERWRQLQARLSAAGADAVVLNGGADLAHLTGYAAMPLERLTALVARADHDRPSLLVPRLELARVGRCDDAFELVGWSEEEVPAERLVEIIGDADTVVLSDDLWAMHVLAIGRLRPGWTLRTVSEALTGVRVVKTREERDALRAAGALADQVMGMVQSGAIGLVGRSEEAIAADIADHLLRVGHQEVQFVIVASGPNSASPHHHPGDRVVAPGEMVLFDFGGTHNGYNSDTTRCVYTGEVPADVAAAYDVLMEAQQAAVEAAVAGGRLCDVDRAARSALTAAGHGEAFIHRTGHGIGTEVHEQPYVTESNTDTIEVGYAFSIEPGVYYEGRWGMRLEDIVVIGDDGSAIRCNHSDRHLIQLA